MSLLLRWADLVDSRGTDGTARKFDHPFVQATAMFFGETLCFIVYKSMLTYYLRSGRADEDLPDTIKGNRGFNPLIFLPPALCDMTATSLMYIGLNMTSSASFQMLRGALIVFTGVLSVVFLKRKLRWFHWLGIFLVTGGLVIVGLNDILTNKSGDFKKVIIGMCAPLLPRICLTIISLPR